MAARGADPTTSSAPSSSSGFGIRNYFRRAVSQSPPPSASSVEEPQAGQKDEPQHQQTHNKQQLRPMQRSAVFGSCAQSVGTVASVLFAVVNRSGHFDETARDSAVTRQAKILYVSLLESVQKERGEWQGFSSSDPSNNNGPEDTDVQRPRELLTTSIDMKSTAEQLGVLNELLEVSFRNLMGPLVPLELYTRHRKVLLRESLAVPPALTTLLAIRGVLDRLEREVRHCLLRLLALWDLIALVSGEAQPLRKTITDKHHHVFSESSEFESMTARKSERQDTVAIDLLQIMVLYRDILFSDIEFILTKQELQTSSRLIEDIRASAWPPDSEPAAPSEEEDDRFSSDGDISSSLSDENQVLHDGEDSWGMETPSEPGITRRPRASSSVPSVPEDGQQQNGDHYHDYEDGEDEEAGWSIPSPTRYSYRHHHQDRKTQRSRSMASPPISGGAGPLVPVPMMPTSSEGIPPPSRTDMLTLVSRPIERIPSGRRHSQRSLSTNPDSPTHSTRSQASSSTRSSSRKLKLRTKQRSSSAINSNGRLDRQRQDNYGQDTASSESRSPPPPSRSTVRRSGSKRLRDSKTSSIRLRRAPAQSADQGTHDNAHREIQTKPTGDQSFLSLAVSYLTIPVAAATLCVIATMATLAIYETRKAPRN
ncbi:hypothetical protein PR003_g13202 [Phytophthora rubi]|uniref:Uncharacterized protein n=1 Tax=Phytophthora rubi TaxID=129364 RepID=A0A6A3M3P2_9STRA|nr:hypothetical protein PR002_g12735 [Phytophthora rubi]KAE9025047.1 hypothetical protein PR001_g12529 [Phytophthora rubi]KAE9335081.1 hypothetical protein PR003_g13202 [Phytophthora rubi]